MGLALVQVGLGAWVSSNYAVLACPDFPLCQGRLVPEADFASGFGLWRELGRDADGNLIPFSALVAIHWVHRSFAWLVFAVAGGLVWRSWRLAGLAALARLLALLLLLQFATGLSTIVFAWPLPLAVLHNGGAAALVATLVAMNLRCAQAARQDRAREIAAGMVRAHG